MLLDELYYNADDILSRLTESKLNAYRITQDLLHQVSVDDSEYYRRVYTGFYRLRLPVSQAYDTYFALLEENKFNQNISLEEILLALQKVTNRLELSFASKLLATINANMPPLDKIVLGHLGLSLPKNTENNRLGKCILVHNQLIKKMNLLVDSESFFKIKNKFTHKYPSYHFTDVKILDLMLWQYRP